MLTAGQFVANIPQQQKYLSGENYYDNCPLDYNINYLMRNSFLIQKKFALSLEQDSSILKMMPYTPYNQNNYPNQDWRFAKMGRGWWKITNRAKGYGYAVDTGVMAPSGNFSGQAWRCMPTQAPGWVRLINSHTGELKSLDINSNTFQAYMADTGNMPGQYWQFVEASLARSWPWGGPDPFSPR